MKRRINVKLLFALIAAIVVSSAVSLPALAEAPHIATNAQPLAAASAGNSEKAVRTIMLYACGADLETNAGMATYNLQQILKSRFSADEDVRLIVMTGGANRWYLSKGSLSFTEGVSVPQDAVMVRSGDQTAYLPNTSQISNVYNQLWEAKGADAPENAGKLVLLDGDGITGADVAVKSEDELMSDPKTLKAFIDYCAANYPAEKYDLILWDHGGGPQNGFGIDQHFSYEKYDGSVESIMSFASIIEALKDNKVTDGDGDGALDGRFDFVDFDACLMGNVELSLVLADYANYYIASTEVEPGYGQYYGPGGGIYTGWLDVLGKDPSYDTFALGKVIVDDYYEFYAKEEGDGSTQDGTLAVFDLQKMVAPETGFVTALSELGEVLKSQATTADADGHFLFYDELRSFLKAFNNGDIQLFDLGGAAAMLGVISTEVSEGEVDEGGHYVNRNAYTELSETFYRWFQPDSTTTENPFMYGRCTPDIQTGNRYYRAVDESGSSVDYGMLYTSGLSLYFPGITYAYAPIEYFWAMDSVLESMPVKDDGRYAFLKSHEEVVADYGLILLMGRTVDQMLDYTKDDFEVKSKDEMNAEMVLDQWRTETGEWDTLMLQYFAKREAGEAATIDWLQRLIAQQIEDAVFIGNVTAIGFGGKDGEGYKVTVNGANKRIIESVERNFTPELPAVKEYLATLSDEDRSILTGLGPLSVGSTTGTLDDLPADSSIDERIAWYNQSGGVWSLDAKQSHWYAIKDADGNEHIASIYLIDGDWIYIPALIGSREYAEDKDRMVMLEFHTKSGASSYPLATVYYMNPQGGPISIDPKRFTQDIDVMPIMYLQPYFSENYYVPISKSPFTISADNMNSISLEYMDVGSISDIEDVNGDGRGMASTISITDIYGFSVDVTSRIQEAKVVDIRTFEATLSKASFEYTGKPIEPIVTVSGLRPDCYTVRYANNTRVGTAKVTITGKEDKGYTGVIAKTFVIGKAENPLAVKGKTAKINWSMLRGKAQKLDVSQVLKFTRKGVGALSYAKQKGDERIVVNKKTGAVKVKKGLRKGLYKTKVKVSVAGNANYKKLTKTVTFKVKVK